MAWHHPTGVKSNNGRRLILSIWLRRMLLLLVDTQIVWGYISPGAMPWMGRSFAWTSMIPTASTQRCQPRTTFILSAVRTDDDADNHHDPTAENIDDDMPLRRQLHDQVKQLDPDWYQEYVLDILGQDVCQSKWPAVLHYSMQVSSSASTTTTTSSTKEKTTTNTAETITSTTTIISPLKNDDTPSDSSLAPNKEESSSPPSPATTNVVSTTEIKSANDNDNDKEEEKLSAIAQTPIDLEKTVITVEDALQDNNETVPGGPLMATELCQQQAVDSEMALAASTTTKNTSAVATAQVDDDTTTTSLEDSVGETLETLTASTRDKVATTTDSKLFDDPKKEGQNEQAEMPPSAKSNETSARETGLGARLSPLTSRKEPKTIDHPTELKVAETTDTPNVAAPTTLASDVIVYRDSKKGWTMVEMKVLKDLGYIRDEIQELQPDALAIIVQDNIRRPRTLGLPSAWTVGPTTLTQSSSPSNKKVQIVANIEQAKELMGKLQALDQEKERWSSRRTNEPTSTTTSRSPQVKRTDEANTSTKKATETERSSTKPVDVTTSNVVGESIQQQNVVLDQNRTRDTLETHQKEATSTQKEPEAEKSDDRFVVYKDIRNALAFVPLTNLTRLGYQVEEIQAMQAEALSIILEDQIVRPRSGIPPQWKISDTNAPDIELVETIAEAQIRVEADETERRRRRAVETESTKFKRSKKWKADESEDTAEQEQLPKLSEDAVERSERRRTRGGTNVDGPQARGDKLSTKKKRQPADDPASSRRSNRRAESGNGMKTPPMIDDDGAVVNERRLRQRRNQNEDGSLKRIYNARELPNRQNKIVRPDPPDPRFWMDMDTFRNLLRTEAQVRLGILSFLGDDWAPIVKQESEWRLNLYKNWLWTLHNGVGEPIVPASRYERARKLKEAKLREEEEEEEPILARRSTSNSLPTRESRKRRPDRNS